MQNMALSYVAMIISSNIYIAKSRIYSHIFTPVYHFVGIVYVVPFCVFLLYDYVLFVLSNRTIEQSVSYEYSHIHALILRFQIQKIGVPKLPR